MTHEWSPLVCAAISLSSERFDRFSLFLPEVDEEALSTARGTDACEVRLDVGNHHQLAPSLSGFFMSCLGVTDVAGFTRACKIASLQAAILPYPPFLFSAAVYYRCKKCSRLVLAIAMDLVCGLKAIRNGSCCWELRRSHGGSQLK